MGLGARLQLLKRRLFHSKAKKVEAPQFLPGESLSAFLLDSKQRYLAAVAGGKGKEWTVVMGNEAGDLDTVASSIAYAWFASTTTGIPHVALLQTTRKDFKLRPENLYAFFLSGLTAELQELLCIDDLPSVASASFPSDKFALVDHNRLLPKFADVDPPPTVVAVLDHHEDEGLYTESANPRTIQVPTGSCTSLVTLHILKTAGPDFKIPPELATFLLTGIMIDTNGLKEGGKAVQADHDAAAFLIPRSSLASSGAFAFSTLTAGPLQAAAPVKDLAAELRSKKGAVEHLTTPELLRRDYKQYAIPSSWTSNNQPVSVGLATVPLALELWLGRDADEFWTALDSFMDEAGLDVLGILTSFKPEELGKKKKSKSAFSFGEVEWNNKKKEKKNKRKQRQKNQHNKKKDKKNERKPSGRQAVFVVRELADGGLEERLWAGIESPDIGFGQWPFEEFTDEAIPNGGVGERKARAYEQGGIKQSRKTIAPLVRRVIEGPSKNEDAN